MDYRKKIDYKVIRFPKGIENEDRGLNECCCSFIAVADLTSTDTWKNDKKGVFIKKSSVSDSVAFTITKCGETGALTERAAWCRLHLRLEAILDQLWRRTVHDICSVHNLRRDKWVRYRCIHIDSVQRRAFG
jgi:hypothetical protein